MTNLEYAFIVRELQALVGRHFSKASTEGTKYLLKIGDSWLLCEPGVRMHLTTYIHDETGIDAFCQKLRKELDNARLLSVRQINNDRVILLEFDRGLLYMEMFGDGNIVLVRGGSTIASVRRESWADRETRPGAPYSTPKPSVALTLDEALSEKFVAVCMMKLPLGKPYVHEVLRRAGIEEKKPGNSLTSEQMERISGELDSLHSSQRPSGFYEGDRLVDFSLARLGAYSHLRTADFASLSEAADAFYANMEPSDDKNISVLRSRLEKQKQRLEELIHEEKAKKDAGDLIYAHFQEVQQILEDASSARLDEVDTKLAKYKAKADKKEKTVEIEL